MLACSAMITIAGYDPVWPVRFAAEAAELHRALGAAALRIEHVGSTSVPGLAAKPVIDIQISVSSLADRRFFNEALDSLGYVHVDLGDFDRVYPFYTKPAAWPGTHHVHLCAAGSPQEREHLAFRDYLRAHSDAAAEYLSLKRKLAAQHHGRTMESREQYSLAKSDFVRDILARANITSKKIS